MRKLMSLSTIPAVAFLTVTLALAPQAMADSTVLVASKSVAASTAAYWTPERMASAKPVPIPVATGPLSAAAAKGVSEVPQSANEGSATASVRADHSNILYAPRAVVSEEGADVPADVGTSGAHFTSSRANSNQAASADTAHPHRRNGRLFFTKPGQGNFVCSATVQKLRIIVTAGHCVSNGNGGFFTNFLFVPATRNGSAPFQQWNWAALRVLNAWHSGGGGVPNSGDFAVIELQDRVFSGVVRRIGDIVGFAGFQTNSLSNAAHVTAIGYPCNLDNCQIMHRNDAEAFQQESPNAAVIGSDMRGGASGGGWYQNYGEYATGQPTGLNTGSNQIIGVTSYVRTDANIKLLGSSIPGTSYVDMLNLLCARRAGNC